MNDSKVEELLLEMNSRMIRVETKMDTYNSYREKTDDAHNTAKCNEKAISKINDNMTWLWRTMAISIFGAIMTFFGIK